jgi:acetyl esterase
MVHRFYVACVSVVAACSLHVQTALAQTKAAGPPLEPTFADVAYGPAKRNVLDFYQVPSIRPAPLLIYIHAGSFVSGDKQDYIDPIMVQVLKYAGIHLASINYRFVNGKDVLFPIPQQDGARAVQFLRSKADEWNIDPQRVACFGGSAGAGIAMWIGFHDDLADPDNPDPVLRQSTRILAVGSFDGQATYDPIKIRELIGGRAWEHPSMFKMYGVKTLEEALHPTPAVRRLYDQGSPITWLTKDDPPVFMIYDEPDGHLPADAKPGQGIHHPNFGRLLKQRMDELGIENVFINQNAGKNKTGDAEAQMFDFFKKHLGVASSKGVR